MKDYEELKPYFVKAFHIVSSKIYGFSFTNIEIELEKRLGVVHLDQAISYMSEWHSVPLMEFCSHMLRVARELFEEDKKNDELSKA